MKKLNKLELELYNALKSLVLRFPIEGVTQGKLSTGLWYCTCNQFVDNADSQGCRHTKAIKAIESVEGKK